jgi:hypothetical protein
MVETEEAPKAYAGHAAIIETTTNKTKKRFIIFLANN